MKKVSVIVPVYNAEEYLVNCISSLLTQTLPEMEIILVDDCSTDQSAKIISDCRLQFPDKVIALRTEKNCGPGGARNLGIGHATGEYIGFVDSDDLVVSSMYEKMYETAKATGADIVDCGFYHEKEDNAIIYTSDELTGELDGRQRSELIVSGGYIWSKIFKADIIKKDKNCQFREKAILEDADFLTYLFATVKSTANVKEILYKYSYNQKSASNEVASEKYHGNIVGAIRAIYEKTYPLPNYSEIQKAVEYEMTQMFLYGMINAKKYEMIEISKANRMKEELLELRKLIRIGYKDNQYTVNKIVCEDWNYLNMLDL